MPNSQRPREQILSGQLHHLANHELLAVILGSGSSERNVLTLAQEVITQLGQTTTTDQLLATLLHIKGIGPAQATKLLAVHEFGKRWFGNQLTTTINHPQKVAELTNYLLDQSQEQLVGLFLDSRSRLLVKKTLALGGLNSMSIAPRDVFSHALQTAAHSVILVHNHPSGDPTPSHDDITTTHRLVEAGKLLGIILIDHVIVARQGWVSIREQATWEEV